MLNLARQYPGRTVDSIPPLSVATSSRINTINVLFIINIIIDNHHAQSGLVKLRKTIRLCSFTRHKDCGFVSQMPVFCDSGWSVWHGVIANGVMTRSPGRGIEALIPSLLEWVPYEYTFLRLGNMFKCNILLPFLQLFIGNMIKCNRAKYPHVG